MASLGRMPPPEKHPRTLIKVCGVRTPAEAEAILALGADAVGVVVASGSPRQVDPSEALAVARVTGGLAVLVDRDPMTSERLRLLESWPGPVQIHGQVPRLERRHMIAMPGNSSPVHAGSRVSAWLLDAPDAGSGTPWSWSRPAWLDERPLILAGGLSAERVAQAISQVRPWAVDVSSGVERTRGTKDLGLVQGFIQAVRAADAAAERTDDPNPASFANLA